MTRDADPTDDEPDLREVPCDAPPLPAALRDRLAGAAWSRSRVGESGCAVYRVERADGAVVWLKHGHGGFAADVDAEQARLRWSSTRLPVPAIQAFERASDDAWLLTEALPGRTAWQWLDEAPHRRAEVVDALAGFLARLHALPVADCPFEAALDDRLAAARQRMEAGLVDDEDFDDERAGWPVERVWRAMTALLPLPVEAVVTHGDFSLDNLLLRERGGEIAAPLEVAGCIDVGRLGVADRHQDLALLLNNLTEFDEDGAGGLRERLFLDGRLAPPDERRLALHLMLDEFF